MENKILIVDDEPTTIKLLEKYLSKQGYKVAFAESAITGIEILKKEFYPVVLTDINMPGMSGLEFLLWIKQFSPKSQVIVMTAFSSDAIKSFANQGGALSYFEKPVSLKELDNLLRENIFDPTLSKELMDISLTDFITMASISGNSMIINVTDPVNKKSGNIFLKDGNIIHADSDKLQGEEAFYAIMDFENTMFYDRTWKIPVQLTINKPINYLMEEKSKRDINKTKDDKVIVRAVPKIVQYVMQTKEIIEKIKKEPDKIKKMTVYESGITMGFAIGFDSKEEIISCMSEFSTTDGMAQKDNQMIFFDDISVTALFDETGILQELNLGKMYRGSTSYGIAIGDTIERAIEIYGKPNTCTMKGAIWDNLAFFCENSKNISSMRIRKLNYMA